MVIFLKTRTGMIGWRELFIFHLISSCTVNFLREKECESMHTHAQARGEGERISSRLPKEPDTGLHLTTL